ncbi:MAG: hypothetical protein ACRDRU_05670 [Pseudonocardiaceae bacterium]
MTVVAMDVSAEPGDGVDEALVRQLTQRARAEGLKLTGEEGLLARLDQPTRPGLPHPTPTDHH